MNYKKTKKVIDENTQKITELEAKKTRLLKELQVLANEAKIKQIKHKLNN